MDIILYPEDIEGELDIIATVDKSLHVSVVSMPVLTKLRLGFEKIIETTVKDSEDYKYSLIGKCEIQWRVKGETTGQTTTFHVIRSQKEEVILGEIAVSEKEEPGESTTLPIGTESQTEGKPPTQ